MAICVPSNTLNTSGVAQGGIDSNQIQNNVVIRPQAGRAFTLFIRVVLVFIGPHDPLRSATAAKSKLNG